MTGAEPAAVAETHSAIVFFAGDMAYKMKKPVNLGFLDFTSREQREAVCHREVALNRRMAPDTYLGVADVVGPDGAVCDHLVVMRRMPSARRLSTLVTSGADVDDELRAVARLVAAFHASAVRVPDPDAVASLDAVRANWDANTAELRRFAGTVLDEVDVDRADRLATTYLDGRRQLFARRIAEGRVRDGHGDLLTEDIFCLDDGPRVLDCLEFDERLRFGDVLLDAAFLAMDLERLDRPDLGAAFLRWWRDFGGETHPASLADHYVAYRAQVRAKVSCLRCEQGVDRSADARRLMGICLDHLERARVQVVLVGGLPGTGKSTLAAALADAVGLSLLRSDEVRKELAGLAPSVPAGARYEEGIYAREHTCRTYEAMLERARSSLLVGESVVLDASWADERWRARARAIARETSSELVELRCDTSGEEAARRLVERAMRGGDPSDATPAIADAMARVFDPWPEATTVDTIVEPAPARRALAALGGRALDGRVAPGAAVPPREREEP